jgi:hypothetical protein
LAVLGSSTFTQHLNVARSAPNGGEVAIGITNNGNSAYSSLYLQTRNQSGASTDETGQVFVGGGSMVVQSRTNHPINFKSYCDQPLVTVPTSLTISNNATRDVIINTPLIIKSQQTTFEKGIIIGGLHPSEANGLYVSNNAIINGNLTVNGTMPSPFWVAGKIDGSVAGAVPTIVTRKGEYGSEITCVRKTGATVGVYDISWTTPHPDGVNIVAMVSGEGASYSESLGAGTAGYTNTSTKITVIFRKLYSQPTGANEALVDCPFTFYVLK